MAIDTSIRIKDNIDQRIFYFNNILAKWIAFHTNINYEKVNKKKLLRFSLLIVFIHDNWDQLNKLYPLQTKGKPSHQIFSSLMLKFLLSMKTDSIIYHFPKPRFYNITGYFRFLISSIQTTFNLIKAIKKKQSFLATNKILTDIFSVPFIRAHGDLIFSDIYTFLKRKSARKKLKLFFSKNIIGFDIEIIKQIIPSCLVELLPIYTKISSKLSILELHTWANDIYESPLLLINCLFNKNIKIIGYQHGGGYGYEFNELIEAEMNFYDQFLYWGYSKDTIIPFKFREKNDKKKYSFDTTKNTYNTINLILDSFVNNKYCTEFGDIKKLAIKIDLMGKNLNIVLHPNDYRYTKNKIYKFTKSSKIYISAKNIQFNNNFIYFVSIYSTLFWKIIDKKLCFICFKFDELESLTEYHFKLSKLLEKNKILYTFNDFTNLLSKDFLKEIIPNNKKFYKEIDKI